jgi:RNA polymerase sigma factor (sigma-70 family)
VIDALRDGGTPDPAALGRVLGSLRTYLARRFPELDADDLAQATIAAILARGPKLPPIESPWAYLARSARHRAIDELRDRRRRGQVPLQDVGEQPADEDSVLALIDNQATRETVAASLRAGMLAGDELMVLVVTHWLDIAEVEGRAPSTRDLAPLLGVSHTSVANALKRFGKVLAEQRQ